MPACFGRFGPVERVARFLSRRSVLVVVGAALAANFALFPIFMDWVVPTGAETTGLPTITDLQFSWTAEQFSHNLSEWSGVACGPIGSGDPDCTWRGAPEAPSPAPTADGPAGFRRLTTSFDFSLPLLYGLFAIGLLTRVWGLADARRRWLGLAVAAGTVAALCDMCENSLHLWLLRGIGTWEQAAAADFSGGAVAAASVLASIKYGLLLAMIVAASVGLVRRGLERLRAVREA